MRKGYIIPDITELGKCCEIGKQFDAAFEYNDFSMSTILDDEKKVQELIHAYQLLERDRSQDTLHGAFLDITVDSTDDQIKKISHMRVRQSLEIAKLLGIKGVIFHTNYITNFMLTTYREHWLTENEKFYRAVLAEYPMLEIYMENMFDSDPILLQRLAKRMENEKRFGVCLDVAHAFLSDVDIEEWFLALGSFVKHIHINDNFGIEDQHLAVGMGKIPWNQVNQYIEMYTSDANMLIEVKGMEEVQKSIFYIKSQKMYPWSKD